MIKKWFVPKKKYRVRKQFKNEFSFLSGIEAIPMLGGSECLLSKQKATTNHLPIQRHAYILYNKNIAISPSLYISSTCGVKNCVKREHLQAKYCPTEADKKYIKDWLKVYGKEQMAHTMKVPLDIFEAWLSTTNLVV